MLPGTQQAIAAAAASETALASLQLGRLAMQVGSRDFLLLAASKLPT